MPSRRRLLRLGAMAALLLAGGHALTSRANQPAVTLFLPLLETPPEPTPIPDEGLLLAPPSGSVEQAIAWFTPRAVGYTPYDVALIMNTYREWGDPSGLDWFLALAQCAHETGSLTSWWCQRPRRNPAGIGVTGKKVPGTPDNPPGPDWAWHEEEQMWREGLSFAEWASESIPAHLGRLLAYALPIGAGTSYQQSLIDYALSRRPLPDELRGVARTIIDLNGRWAYPGTEYGQRILDLARRMRGG